MSLAHPACGSSYEIVSLLGSGGGTGEGYRARDTRLKREVAVKTFQRERSPTRVALMANDLRWPEFAI